MWTEEDWDRLAQRLEDRRFELDSRYDNFSLFIAERGVNYRTAWDAEHAVEQERMNITRGTMATKLDPAYGYKRGEGCENILNGEDPVLAPGTPGAAPVVDLSGVDPEDQQLLADAATELARILRRKRAEADRRRSA